MDIGGAHYEEKARALVGMKKVRWLEQRFCEFLASLAKEGGPTPTR